MDLDELERLLREATAGPWFVYVHTGDGTTIEPGDDWTVYGKDREPVVHEGGFTVHAAANAALIAALRNHAAELIRDARRYRWLRDNGQSLDLYSLGVMTPDIVDATMDGILNAQEKHTA